MTWDDLWWMLQLDDLRIYQVSMEIADTIFHRVEKWQDFYQRTMGMQLVRSADSICANIAEGYGRYSFKENRTFCFYARGSLLETKTHLKMAKARGLIVADEFKKLNKDLDDLHRSLNAYIKSLGLQPPTSPISPISPNDQ